MMSFQAFGQELKTSKDFERAFESQNYQLIIQQGEKYRGPKKKKAEVNYYVGLAHNRLGNFEEAPKYISKAILKKVKFKDAYFELGQAYYANNEMQKSARAFLESVKKDFKVPTSMYYIAHIAQILEKWKTAKKYYKKIVRRKDVDPKIKQIAQFQLGEVFLSCVKEKGKSQREYVRRNVLPKFEKAIDVNPASPLAKEIFKRKEEVAKQNGLNPDYLVNGAKSPKGFSASFSQKYKYDSNITLTNELPFQQGTLQDSYINNTTASFNYNYVYDQKYILGSSASISNTEHNDDVNQAVYQNDAYSLTGSLSAKKPLTFRGKPTNIGYTFSYTYTGRDREGSGNKIFAGRTLSHSLSYTLPYFKFGPTTFGLSRSSFNAWEASLFNSTTTFSLTQIGIFPNYTMLILFASHSDTAVEDDNNSTATTVFNANYLFLKLLATYTFQVGLSYTLTDTKAQTATRGTEKTISPSIKATKKINKNISFALNFAYTDKSSLDSAFAYTKNVTTFEFKYKF